MSLQEVVRDRRAGEDARLACAVAGGALASYGVFVVLPTLTPLDWLPQGIDGLVGLAGLLTLLLAPVAAGLSAYSSLVMLWVQGGTLPDRARHLHLVTLLLAVVLSVLLASAWGGEVTSWWTD